MKKVLYYLLLIVVISFLNPDYVWGQLIRKFPPEWYEYCCIGAVVTAWLISLGLVVAVFRRLRSQKSIVRYFFIGVLVGMPACSTARFCREVNQHFSVAVLHGNLITADILLHLGADINAADSADGLTPLQRVHSVCFSPEARTEFEPHRRALADWLISRGAIPYADSEK